MKKMELLFGELVHYVETPGDFTEHEAKVLRQECSGYMSELEMKRADNPWPVSGPVFSFRAECITDATKFLREMRLEGTHSAFTIHGNSHIPDVQVEVVMSTGLEDARRIMRGIEDSYVMVETLRQQALDENTLIRDTTVS